MSFLIRYDHDQNVAIIKRSGIIEPGELLKGIQSLTSKPEFTGIDKILSDTSAASFVDINNELEKLFSS